MVTVENNQQIGDFLITHLLAFLIIFTHEFC